MARHTTGKRGVSPLTHHTPQWMLSRSHRCHLQACSLWCSMLPTTAIQSKRQTLGAAQTGPTGGRAAHVGRVDSGDELADRVVLGLQAVAQLIGGRQRAMERLALLRQRIGRHGQQALRSDRVFGLLPCQYYDRSDSSSTVGSPSSGKDTDVQQQPNAKHHHMGNIADDAATIEAYRHPQALD